MNFKAKDLSYDARTPAFLQRLRGEVTGDQRSTFNQARPAGRAKHVTNDEDDGPTYVLEESNETLSKEEYEALIGEKSEDKSLDSSVEKGDEKPAGAGAGAGAGADADADAKDSDTQAARTSKQQVTEAGTGPKKRKLGKVIGAQDETADANDESGMKKSEKPKAKKKKAKAIKLAFGDEEEG